jgi:ElaB/YqjD/DUF883 family membrane-anchored ribosome-binding protein
MSNTDTADLDQVMKDVQALKKDLASLLERVRAGATETVSEEARRLYNTFASESERQAAALAQTVEEKPITSLLIAFAIGFISGRVLIR